jgi:hypothetical protein
MISGPRQSPGMLFAGWPSLPTYPQLRTCRRAAITDAMCQNTTCAAISHQLSGWPNPLELLDATQRADVAHYPLPGKLSLNCDLVDD